MTKPERTKDQTVHSHRRCLYCGVLVPVQDIDRHLGEHEEKWRNAPR